MIATRHLTCPTATGDYSNPARACLALARLRAVLKHRPTNVCPCPAPINIPGNAVAIIHGRRVVVPLDFCTYCGSNSPTANSDLAALQPQT
jgi:hypothetical protein